MSDLTRIPIAQNARQNQNPTASGLLQRQCACGNHTVAGGRCVACAKKGETGGQQHYGGHVSDADCVPPAVHDVLSSTGEPLDPATRVLMESRFGHDFGAIRLHTDSRAAESSQAMHARAYAIGNDVVFGIGHYAPHTSHGVRLIAHELAHTVQQGRTKTRAGSSLGVTRPRDSHELEADRAAEAVVSSRPVTVTPNSLAGIGRDWGTDPAISELHEKVRKQLHDEAYFDLLNEIANPKPNKASLLAKINYLDSTELAEAVGLMGVKLMTDIAGSAAGIEVLQAIRSKLPKGHEQGQVEMALNARSNGPDGTQPSKGTPEDQKALDRINKAISADPHYSDYRAGRGQPGRPGPIVPLAFPVELYNPGLAVDGGVYYDPGLNEAGQVRIEASSFKVTRGKSVRYTRSQFPLAFIRLGPSALSSSDAYLQSTMWHEFQHYRRLLSFRQPDADKSLDVKSLEQEAITGGPDAKGESAETEAASIQLADYFDELTDTDAKSTLLYLARFFKVALPDFKQAAIDRLRQVVAKHPQKRKRLFMLIDSIKEKARRENLKELRESIAKD